MEAGAYQERRPSTYERRLTRPIAAEADMKNAVELDLETLGLEQRGRVLTARYRCRPLNFITSEGIRDLDTLTAAVERDRTVGAVVLTGGVEGRFMTHADPTEIGALAALPVPSLPPSVLRPLWQLTRTLLRAPAALRLTEAASWGWTRSVAWGFRWRRTILRMNRSSTIYIAAINGPTTGGGHEIALACDLRFVSDSPQIRLGQVEILAGLNPGGGGTQRLPKLVGTGTALELMLEGAPFTAQRAHELGLVNAVVSDDELVQHAQEVAVRLARRSPSVVRSIKRLTYFDTSRSLSAGLDSEIANFVTSALQPEMKDILHAFDTDFVATQDSPLASGDHDWAEGTRVDQVGETR